MSSEVMQPLMEIIEKDTEKWRVIPSEYENLKSYYSKRHNSSLEGYDDWFNAHFIILTDDEIKLREERIAERDALIHKRRELLSKQHETNDEIKVLSEKIDLLLKQINWEDD